MKSATGAAHVSSVVEAEDPSLKAQYGGFVSVWVDEADSPTQPRQSLRVALGVRASDCALSGMSPPLTGGSSGGIGELSTSSAEDIEDAIHGVCDYAAESPLLEGIQVQNRGHTLTRPCA